jgi:hypothetical protein
LKCCPDGTATLCPMHRHPCGGDRLRRLRERCSGRGTGASGVHHREKGGATAIFFQRLGELGMVTAADTVALRAVHRPKIPEARVFRQLAGWSPPP